MSRVLASLAAVPVLLTGGALTAAFLLPADRMYLLGPMIAGSMIITMVVLFTLLPRVIRWRLAEMFGEGAQAPGRGGFAGGRRGRPGAVFPFSFGPGLGADFWAGPASSGAAGDADDDGISCCCRQDHRGASHRGHGPHVHQGYCDHGADHHHGGHHHGGHHHGGHHHASHHHGGHHHDHGGSTGHHGHDHSWSGTSSWSGSGDFGSHSSHSSSGSDGWSSSSSDSSSSSSSDSGSSSSSSDSSFSSSSF